ncbi:hypothetical protein SAMD00024442_134_3 [Candidatus Symbiothrix dinenymphae]|nr:hypothetical protein SAMD00024442_134_3 [Candidatus Symbiothrix dinenymphae]
MKNRCLVLCVTTLALFSCADKTLEPINGSLGMPGVVTELETTRIPGGAIVSYRIPDAADLLLVKAVYTITNGQKREATASYYDNHLVLEGFSDTLPHEALIYSISRAQTLSEPVPVTFRPLESSLAKAAKTVRIFEDFGGAAFAWKNEDGAPLTFDFQTTDARGEWQTATIIQSSADSAERTIRGYLPEPRKFRLVVSDNWDNQIAVLPDSVITPLREERLDKDSMSFMHLDNDTYMDAWGGRDIFMIDDDVNTMSVTYEGIYPLFTIDLGKKAKLSRLVVHQRLYDGKYYNQANVRLFSVWHPTVETPSQTGAWSDWVKAMDCECIKPSGIPFGGDAATVIDYTNEDMKVAQAGHNYNFPRDMEPVRYVRIYVENRAAIWGPWSPYGQFAELTFYGLYE